MQPTPDFDPKAAAKKLLREGRTGALATLMAGSGDPYCSLVNVATAADGAPLLLISRLAVHTKNILADPRVSLMLDERKAGDPPRRRPHHADGHGGGDRRSAGAAPLPRPPSGGRDVRGFQATSPFYRIALKGAHLVAGFGRIVDLKAADILTDLSGAEALVAAEADICAHMNGDHADAVRLYATKLLGAPMPSGAASAAIPEGSSCSTISKRCACRSRSALRRRACCARC